MFSLKLFNAPAKFHYYQTVIFQGRHRRRQSDRHGAPAEANPTWPYRSQSSQSCTRPVARWQSGKVWHWPDAIMGPSHRLHDRRLNDPHHPNAALPSIQPSHLEPAPSSHGLTDDPPQRCSPTFDHVRRNGYTFSNSCARRSVGKLARTCHD